MHIKLWNINSFLDKGNNCLRKNNSLLTKLIKMDEGSAYLGECALVPYDSPISQSGLLFYNTLFDENAACHLALGMGFADTIEGFEKDDELQMSRVEPFEEVIDELIESLKSRHTDRMVHGLCDVVCGIHYQNILMHLERISDQCSDLAVYQLGRNNEDIKGQEHQYLQKEHTQTLHHHYYQK